MRLKLAALVAAIGISATSAFAADIPVARPAPMPAKAPAMVMPMFNWSGVYIGIHGGGAWGSKDWTEVSFIPGLPEGSFDVSGWLVGGQIGANMQVGQWVFGIEADGSYADINGARISAIDPFLTIGSKIEALATFTGRLGYAWDMVLLYVKGGGAWAREVHSTSGTYASSFSENRWGWTVGGGIEVAMSRNWSIRGDYAYIDFGNVTTNGIACVPACGLGVTYNEDIAQHLHVFKAAINYRF